VIFSHSNTRHEGGANGDCKKQGDGSTVHRSNLSFYYDLLFWSDVEVRSQDSFN
jgi:hypothetical protein